MVKPPHPAVPNPSAKRSSIQLRDEDLAAFEGDVSARRLAVLAGDQELALQLAMQRYEGPKWAEFARVLAEYGLQVMKAWIATGLIFQRCAAKRILLRPTPRTNDDALELASETVAWAIVGFKRTVLMKNRWNPAKGASLKTFFIGQCVLRFGNVYRRWLHERRGAPCDAEELAKNLHDLGQESATVTQVVELRRQAPRVDRDSVPAIEAVMELGYSAAEIAEVLQTTTSAIENRLYHYRLKAGTNVKRKDNRGADRSIVIRPAGGR